MPRPKHPASDPRWIEYAPLDGLPDHPDNPRHHDQDELRASIERFGFTGAFLIDGRTGLLAEGHGRKKALQAIRDDPTGTPPPGVRVEEDGWHVPIVRGWASAGDFEAKAYLLASNQGGGWYDQQLADLLTELAEHDALAGTQFDVDRLEQLLAELGTGELPAQDTDAAHADTPERGDPDTPRTSQGMHEVGLMFQGPAHAEFLALIAALKVRWEMDLTPLVVLRALKLANGPD